MINHKYKDEDWEDDAPDISDAKRKEHLAQLSQILDFTALITVKKEQDEETGN